MDKRIDLEGLLDFLLKRKTLSETSSLETETEQQEETDKKTLKDKALRHFLQLLLAEMFWPGDRHPGKQPNSTCRTKSSIVHFPKSTQSQTGPDASPTAVADVDKVNALDE